MNIVELNEKNLTEALKTFKKFRNSFYSETGRDMPDDEQIKDDLFGTYGDEITYVFTEKGNCFGLVTIDKPNAEIRNLTLDLNALEKDNLQKVLDFSLKQFSAISLVFVWVSSLDGDVIDVLETYGFEYTGEQDYIDKEKHISSYRYVYRRKR